MILPSPPPSEAPPMTTATMTSSSSSTESVGSPSVRFELHHARDAGEERRARRRDLHAYGIIPQSRAAASLLPTAKTWRPKPV